MVLDILQWNISKTTVPYSKIIGTRGQHRSMKWWKFHSPNSIGVTEKFKHRLLYIPQVPASQTTINCPCHHQILIVFTPVTAQNFCLMCWNHNSDSCCLHVPNSQSLIAWGWSKAARNVGRPDGAINDTFMASKSAQRLSNSWIPQFDSLIPWARHHKLFTSGLAPINTVHLLSVLLEDLQWPCGPGGIPEL